MTPTRTAIVATDEAMDDVRRAIGAARRAFRDAKDLPAEYRTASLFDLAAMRELFDRWEQREVREEASDR